MSAPPDRHRPHPLGRLVEVGLVFGAVALPWAVIAWFTDIRTGSPPPARSEMAQLADAVAAFKAKMNVGHIPAGFRLKAAYDPADPEAAYLRNVFPQLDLADTGLPPGTDDHLDPNQALVFFLTGGKYTDYKGFSTDRRRPFRPSDGLDNRIGPFLDLLPRHLDAAGHLLDPWGTPYVYLAFDPTTNGYPDRHCFGVRPYRVNGKAMNPRGFQLISAGPDGRFGPGGDWAPGEGPWAADGPGADDIGNFNSGPLGRRGE
ncbi:MAG: hypothetical protein K2X87_11090 [Gemmataceae bacterium]|nr:hypothetical protein [Gemmataceae bacterium]